ncbi:type I restriction enzyme S subunit [Nocardia tenerifensis]|uniref:Type I restriction enzyme S subunit n=2 Tax=Nocardia tenerifensis TaxID=228006 RepID=A0A318K0U1_9NOCA|nr:type I restriction enzyme S subunit [Nocardia tenerifensis]
MVLIRPNSNVLNFRFLRYWLNSSYVRDFIEGMREGSGAPRINMPTIRELLTPLPPIGEQNSVARLLGALDDKIAVNERIAATADELVLAIASSERWEARIPLGEICTLRKDQISPAEISEPQVDHYSLPAFDSQKRPERTSPGTIKSGKFLVATPAVLFSKLNPEIPRVWNVTPANAVPALASTEFLVLTPRGDVSTHELWAVTAQQDFREVVAARVTGTSKSHQRVRPTDVLAAEVVDPRRFGAVQQQINSLALSALAARKESVVLASLRDTLLPQITSGRLRVKEAEMIIEDHA